MGKPQVDFEITDKKLVYVSNEIISGNLVIETNDSFSFKEVEIKFKGYAGVHWTESKSAGEHTYTEHYVANEKYFYQVMVLADSRENPTISAGRTFYPFKFQLPPNLPSSIEVPDGWVRYKIKAKIVRSGLSGDIKAKMLFTVLDVNDLNYNPQCLASSTGSDTKQLCCWCCASGPIEGKVNTDKSAYVPGEIITINGSIENHSSTNLPRCKLKLVKNVTQHSTRKTRSIPIKVESCKGPSVRSHSSANISNERIQIPPLPASPLRFCNIIEIQYFVQLCVKTPSCHNNLRVPAYIDIGTIPHQSANTANYGQDEPASKQGIYATGVKEGSKKAFKPLYNYYGCSPSVSK